MLLSQVTRRRFHVTEKNAHLCKHCVSQTKLCSFVHFLDFSHIKHIIGLVIVFLIGLLIPAERQGNTA